MVRIRAVGPRADDDELDRPMALLDDRGGDVGGDLSLGAPRAQPGGYATVHGIDRRAGATQLGDLLVILDHPALPEDGRGEFEPRLQSLADRHDVQRGKRIRDADARDGARRRGHEGVRILAVHPVGDRQSQLADGRTAHLGELHAWDDHRSRAPGRKDQRGQPLDGVALDAEEVLEVGAGADDDRVETGSMREVLRALQAAGVDGGGEGRVLTATTLTRATPLRQAFTANQLIAWRMRAARNSRSFSVSAVTAYAVGQTVPSSRWEIGSKPKVP